MEAYRFTHTHQPHALLKLAIQVNRAVHIFHRNFIRFALNGHVAFNMVQPRRTAINVQRDATAMVSDIDFAMAMGHVDVASHVCNRNIAAAGSNQQSGVSWYVNIHVGGHALVAGPLRTRVQRDNLISGNDDGFRLAVVVVGILLFLRTDLLSHRHLHRLAIGHIDRDGAAIVIDVQAAARRNVLAQFVAIVESGTAKNFVQSLIVAELYVFADVLPVQTRRLGCDQSGNDDEQHQENASNPNAARLLPRALCLFVLDQFDRSPQNKQSRPEPRTHSSQSMYFENAHRPQQKQDSHQDQNHWPSSRALWRPRSRR